MTIRNSLLLRLMAMASVASLVACAPQADRPAKADTLVDVVTAELVPHVHKQVLTGSVQASAQTPTAFLTSGRITALEFAVGERVKAGDVLARLSPTEQEADVEAAQAGVAAAQSRLVQAKTAYDRQSSLWDQGLTTRSAFDGARTAWETATSSAQSAQAQLNLAMEALSYTTLTARADGVIVRKLANVDEIAQAGSPVYVIAEDGLRHAVINVQEAAIAGWDMNRDVTVSVISTPDVTTTGRVTEIAPALDATGTVPIKVEINDTIALGVPVSVSLSISEHDGVILPSTALGLHEGQASVWIVDANNGVQPRHVEVERYETGTVILASGLESGERVVVTGTQFLSPGLVVVPREITSK